MSGMLDEFASGFASFFRGFVLLARTPRLWPFALAPFFIGIAIMVSGFFWAIGNLPALMQGLLFKIESLTATYFPFVYGVVMILVWPAFLMALLYAVFLLAMLIASPFHAVLAERSLIALTVLKNEPFQFMRWLRSTVHMIVVSVLKVLIFTVVGLALFVLSFIPLVNFVAGFGFLLVITFDCTDFSFEALQMGLRARLRYFFSNFMRFSGFAAALGLVFLVPGFNFLLMPVAVVGGSDLVSRKQKGI